MGLDALLKNQLGHHQGQGSKSCTYTLFLAQGGERWNLGYFCSTGNGSEIWAHFQNCHIWAWNLASDQSSRSCTYTLFLPQGSKLSIFLLYRQPFPRYRPIFKIAIFGHETWQVAKVQKVVHIPSFYPKGSKLSLFLTLRAAVSEIQDNFQNCHIWAWNLAIGHSPRRCTIYSLSTPWGQNWAH